VALVECKECSAEISESAAICPQCGIATPGISDGMISISARRLGFLQQRWVAGLAFWPGVIMILIPVFSEADKEVFLSAWSLSKWLMGFGLGWYVLSEIERNLYERKLAKQGKG